METIKFKTSLKCGGCVANVKPQLDALESVENWEVNLAESVKILTVNGDDIKEFEVIDALKQSGYTAERIA